MKFLALTCFTVGIYAAVTPSSTPPVPTFTSPYLNTSKEAPVFGTFRALVVCSPLAAVVPSCAGHCIENAMSVAGCTDRANTLACQCIPASSIAIHEHAFGCVIDSCGALSMPAVLSAGVSVCGCINHGALPGPTRTASTFTSLAETTTTFSTTTTPAITSNSPPPTASCGVSPCQAKADAVPACATDCIASAALAAAGCGPQDYHCQCANNDDIHAEAFSCVTAVCKGRDAANVLSMVASLCSCVEGSPINPCAGPPRNDPVAVQSPPPPPPPPPQTSLLTSQSPPPPANTPTSTLLSPTPNSSTVTSSQTASPSTSLSIPQPAVPMDSETRNPIPPSSPDSSSNSIPVPSSSATVASITSVHADPAHVAPTPAAGVPYNPVPDSSTSLSPVPTFSSPGSSEPESSVLVELSPVSAPASSSASFGPVPSIPTSDTPTPVSSSPGSPAPSSSAPISSVSGSLATDQAGLGVVRTLILKSSEPPSLASPSLASPSSTPEIPTTISPPISTLLSFTAGSSASTSSTIPVSIPSSCPGSSSASSTIFRSSSSSLPDTLASGGQSEKIHSVGSETSGESKSGESFKTSSASPSKTANHGKSVGSSRSGGTRYAAGFIPGIVGAACIAVAASV